MPLWRRRRSVADGFSLPASAQGDTFSSRLSEMQATTSQTRPTLTQLQPEIHVVCFLTRYRSAWAEYNLFPIKSIKYRQFKRISDVVTIAKVGHAKGKVKENREFSPPNLFALSTYSC